MPGPGRAAAPSVCDGQSVPSDAVVVVAAAAAPCRIRSCAPKNSTDVCRKRPTFHFDLSSFHSSRSAAIRHCSHVSPVPPAWLFFRVVFFLQFYDTMQYPTAQLRVNEGYRAITARQFEACIIIIIVIIMIILLLLNLHSFILVIVHEVQIKKEKRSKVSEI